MKLSETNRTLVYVAVALVSVGAASLTRYVTHPKPDSEYQDVGQEFYPKFVDPTTAQSLRVVAYDKDTASIKQFKVDYRNGKWRIPSHHDYPADGKDRLARTAASVIGTAKTALVSRLKSQQARYEVVDPEDTDPTVLTGRGQKITISQSDGTALAEFVVGKPAEGQTDVYYVRGTKTEDPNGIYLAKLKIDLSTKFGDWIEPDLLKVDRDKLTDIRSDNYSIDEQQGVLVPGEITELTRKTPNDPWTLKGLDDKKEEIKTDVVNQIVNNLDGLRLVGVRPKPPGINPDLSIDKKYADSREMEVALQADMANHGFYLARDRNGLKVVSKEGEFGAGTNEGLRYALRFGQIFHGTEFDIETGLSKSGDKSKDAKKDGDKKGDSTESKTADKSKEPTKKGRYLMVFAAFDPKLLGDPPQKPSEPKKPNGLVLDGAAPANGKAKPNAAPNAKGKPGDKQSSNDPQSDSNMLALAFDDPKTDAKSDAKSPSPPATKKPTGSTKKTADKAKPAPAAKPAAPPAAKPDPKAEYEKAMADYKRKVEEYENNKSEYEKKLKNGEKKAKELNERFGPWYYVISAESFENLRLTHAGLVKPKEAPGAQKPALPNFGMPGQPPGN
jgi:Domain of unknown function (DUF4340)